MSLTWKKKNIGKSSQRGGEIEGAEVGGGSLFSAGFGFDSGGEDKAKKGGKGPGKGGGESHKGSQDRENGP